MPGLTVSLRPSRRTSTTGASVAFRGDMARLEKAIDTGTRDADRIADQVARAWLPTRGGFSGQMATKTEIHRSKIPGGLRLTFDGKGSDLARINAGRLRHPVWGNDEVWRTQTVRPGYADETMRRVKAQVDAEMRRAVGR